MRVGLVVYGSVDTRTGGYLYDRMLLDHLASRGDETEVVVLPRGGYARHLGDNVSPSLLRRLAGGGFDVLLEDELSHPSLALANRRIRARTGCPIVCVVHLLRTSEHHRSRLRRLYAGVERRYLATVDAAVFNCETTRAAAEGLLGHSLPGVVAYPGCDHLAADAPRDPEERTRDAPPLRVLSVANVAPVKGLHTLVEALGRLPSESWRLTVVGSLTTDRVYADRLRATIAGAGMAANVDLVGSVANHRIPRYLARSHVLAVPSSYEAVGIAYLEAMRFGLPVIATTAGGAHEIVGDGLEGFLVAPGDVDALAGHLGRLARDRELLLAMSRAARARAARHPTWDRSLAPVRALLCSLVERRGGRVPRGSAT